MTHPIIHIRAQQAHHDDAYIVCNYAGVKALHAALSKAIVEGVDQQCEVSTTDGEGYDIHIIVTERDDIALPYTEDYAKEHRENVVWPWEMVG